MARIAKVKKEKISSEMMTQIKAFKSSSEVESFYQFIHENNLRAEAHNLMTVVLKAMTSAKKKKKVIQ